MTEEPDFDKVLTALSRCKRQGDLYIALMPPFAVTFQLFDKGRETLADEVALADSDRERLVRRIENMVQVILDDEVDSYITHIAEHGSDSGQKEAKEEELRGQIERVRKALLDDRLIQRHQMKISSKAPTFTDIDWDIKVKRYDAKREITFPYATCKIKFQRDFEITAVALLSGRQFDSVQINFTSDDLEYLTTVLNSVRAKLKTLESEVT